MQILKTIDTDKKLLNEIIKNESITTLFQPIVSLTDGSVMGYEALSRGPKDSILESPLKLFDAAARYNLLWEIEYLCRTKAIQRGIDIVKSKNLFINIDPKIIHDEKFKSGMTRDFIAKYNINTANIILEITEGSYIEDYKSFKSVINNYINQGYRIAIDDTGAGYSGLRMLAEMHPNYIKIDMELIRDIDKKLINQVLIKTLNDFASATNMNIIAEGIETIDELHALIDIGIKYGQGYLLQKPSKDFLEINNEVRQVIAERQAQKHKQSVYTPNSMPIGEIARFDKPISPMTVGSVVNEIFTQNSTIYGIPVVDNGIPVGLIMRNNFYANLATQYGVAVFMNRPIKLLMNKNPLTVDYNTSLTQVSKNAIGRREEDLYDYIIITKNDRYYGVTTIKNLLEFTTQLELNRAKHSNPLTGLPGNIIIEEKLNKIIQDKQTAYIIYFDLDNFKAYNDIYGFENGDKIITYTSNVIKESIDSTCLECSSSFLGHIGGDDFIAIVHGNNIEELCKSIVQNFDKGIKKFYNDNDRDNGYITAKNRHGVEEKFPVISISVAGIDTGNYSFQNSYELSEILSKIKKRCKLKWESCYIIE